MKSGLVLSQLSSSRPPTIPPITATATYQPMPSKDVAAASLLPESGLVNHASASSNCEDYHKVRAGTRNEEPGARSQELETHALRNRGDYNGVRCYVLGGRGSSAGRGARWRRLGPSPPPPAAHPTPLAQDD